MSAQTRLCKMLCTHASTEVKKIDCCSRMGHIRRNNYIMTMLSTMEVMDGMLYEQLDSPQWAA